MTIVEKEKVITIRYLFSDGRTKNGRTMVKCFNLLKYRIYNYNHIFATYTSPCGCVHSYYFIIRTKFKSKGTCKIQCTDWPLYMSYPHQFYGTYNIPAKYFVINRNVIFDLDKIKKERRPTMVEIIQHIDACD